MADFYFDEIISILKIDNQVVYDRVSRINAKSEDGDFYLELDVHSEYYPMLPGEKHRMVISNTLNMDGSVVSGYFPEGKQKSLADKFEFVMHGLLYKMAAAKGLIDDGTDKAKEDGDDQAKEPTNDGNDDVKAAAYISFGGLQLMLRGDPLKMHKFKVDQRLFLLLRKM